METVADILAALEEIYPRRYAFPDDNCGLILGELDAGVSTCAVSLDPDEALIGRAIGRRAGLLVTHHPLLFRATKAVTATSPEGRGILLAARRINIVSCHTNCDFAPGGLCDELAKRIGLESSSPLTELHGVPVGRFGNLSRSIATSRWLARIEKEFGGELRWSGSARRLSRVAVCTGSGADLLRAAVEKNCDALVTGDVKYHAAREAEEHARSRRGGFLLVDGGHFGTERHFVPLTIARLREFFPRMKFIPIEARAPFQRGRR